MKKFTVVSKVETVLTLTVNKSHLSEIVKSQIVGLFKDYAPEVKFSWFGSILSTDNKDFEVTKCEYAGGTMVEFFLTKRLGSEIVEVQSKAEEGLFG